MRENALVAFVADSFPVKGAYTVVVVGACLAFTAFSFEELLAKKLGISYCLARLLWWTLSPVVVLTGAAP